MLLGANATLGSGIALGLKVGALFVAASLWVNYTFANRGMTLWLIDAGFHVVRFVLFGIILAPGADPTRGAAGGSSELQTGWGSAACS
jgi:hypothetical protein